MIDLAILLAFVLWGLASGLRARRQASQGLHEYFLAGRSLPGWQAGTSMAATQFAADTPLLVTGLVATAGVFALWRLWIYGLAFLLFAFLFAAWWRRAGVLTDAELTEVRYSGRGVLPLRVLKAVYYGTVINCVVLAMVLVAAIRIAEVFLPWHQWLPSGIYEPIASTLEAAGVRLGESVTGLEARVASANNLISIALILAFTATYSITGGLRAVVRTDVLQLAIALLGTALYAFYVIDAVGGLNGLGARIAELYGERGAQLMSFGPAPGPGEWLTPFFVLVGMQWLFQMNADGTGYLAQRAMACRSERDARVAGVVFAWLQILLRSLLWLAIALGLLVLYPFDAAQAQAEGFAAARELLFVQGIADLLPPGVRGLMLVGLLAALASTVDTHLNWGASYWSNDLYDGLVCRRILRRAASGRELVRVARLSNVLILVLAMAVMARLGSIQTAWFISLLFGAGMGGVLVLRWLWERVNLQAEVAAMVASLVTAPLLLVFWGTAPGDEWKRLAVMAAVSTGVAVIASLVTAPTQAHTLDAFYRRVRPLGWWGRTARRCGENPGAPLRGLVAPLRRAAGCALSLFTILYGLGKLLFPAPGEGLVAAWVALAVGLALVPLWWRALRS
ncbi:sodium:solute symporter family protein [Ramlibacter rhizophilus]|uniref:Sodium transporter n=1 Tax=Ramlibacter rhizophilus TaxID=1781167 RepID=A0A4Z0BY86_9BURK|nr:sodium:solute symporter family protein [Ramlibacter rhizophilus]TFZ03270.1 sodium transporter [Ramlibacter rhizophilus]